MTESGQAGVGAGASVARRVAARRVAAGAAAALLALAGCTTSGSPSPGASSSQATSSASASSGGTAIAPGAAVKTTANDVAGYVASGHKVSTRYSSPDRQHLTSNALPPGFAAPPPGSGRQRYLDQKIHWTSCLNSQCAKVLVPLDWDHPDGQAITIAMKKRSAKAGNSATMFVNPGGPGGSGQDMVDQVSVDDFPDHDLIGWDPRGSGESTPVVCGTNKQTDDYLATDTSPDDAAEWTALTDESKAFAKQCRDGSGVLLDHISTIDNVRDLDYLRYLVGDKKLDYLGISYGTFIGAVYAELYPQRTGRMVLDSAVNITDDDSVIQPMGFDLALKNYATWCVQNKCGLGNTQDEVVKAATGVLDQLDRKPLDVQGRQLTQSLGTTGMVTYLYLGEEGYQQLTESIRTAQQGNGLLLLSTADMMNGRDARGNYGSMTYSFPAIACADAGDPGAAGVKKEWASDEKKAPILDPYFGPNMQCVYWSARPTQQLLPTGKGAAPILVLGATGDPATPYQQAVSMAKQLQSGVLLTWKGAGHSAFELGNDCVKNAVKGFINSDKVPKDGTVC